MSATLRVLTVRQPWAWAIIHGGKDVENRVRSLGPYRGPVAIHAGVGPFAKDNDASRALRAAHGTEVGTELVFGAVIGVVDLYGVHEDCSEPVEGYGYGPVCSEWAMTDHHHLCLGDPRPLERPIPATGRLGLWHPDDKLEDAIWEQVAR
jgi:hypothetical protein